MQYSTDQLKGFADIIHEVADRLQRRYGIRDEDLDLARLHNVDVKLAQPWVRHQNAQAMRALG